MGCFWTGLVNTRQSCSEERYIWSFSDSIRNWISVGISGNSQYMAAQVFLYPYKIYSSSDYGATFNQRDLLGATRFIREICFSDNGQYGLAVGGEIFTSSDYGITWVNRGNIGTFESCAMSADGNVMYAGKTSGTSNFILKSTDFGVTWTPLTNSYKAFGLACSNDGTIVYSYDFGQYISKSNDSGATFNNITTGGRFGTGIDGWGGISCDNSGNNVVVCTVDAINGDIYTSNNGGSTWNNYGVNAEYRGVSLSGDGLKILNIQRIPLSFNYYLNFSDNFGVSYSRQSVPEMQITPPRISRNGTKGIIAGWNEYIYTSYL